MERNNSEINKARSTKYEANSNDKNINIQEIFGHLTFKTFGIVSSFGLRISNLLLDRKSVV